MFGVFLHYLHNQIEGFVIFWVLEQVQTEGCAEDWISYPHLGWQLWEEGAYAARRALGYSESSENSASAARFWGRHLAQALSGHFVAYFASLMFSQCLSCGQGWGRVP